jgi:erythronate-4-phosphate dehydrogenase
MKIIADNKIPFLKGVLEPFAEVEYLSPDKIVKDKLIDADALIVRTRTKCNASLLEGTKVKFIATATIGYDHIDADYCASRDIKWINAPGCNSSSVKQYITAALLKIAEKKNYNLKGMTLGIVGVGNVGSKVETAARLLGMNVLLNDPPRARAEGDTGFRTLDEIAALSDIITFHVPLNKEGIDKTRHLADESFFAKVKKGAVLFNSSRGPVVETNALKNAIEEGIISGCVLDVWENEPNIDLELLKMVDIATPHIAGYSSDGKANGTGICVNAINEFFNLGMEKNWYPSEIPNPFNPVELKIECRKLSDQNILLNAVSAAYNIMDDDAELKKHPEEFEQQRNYYKVRREFHAYTLTLMRSRPEIANALAHLGFKVLAY